MRWLVRAVLVVIVLLVVATVAVYAISTADLNRSYDIPAQALTLSVPTDAASVERGRHFATAIAKCSDCHSADLGGKVFLDVPPFLITAPNLTRGQGGLGSSLTDADIVRAVRDGVAPNGHALLIMPSSAFQYLSDEDLGDIIAFVRARPPVDRTLPANDVRPLGRVLLVIGALPPPDAATIDHSAHPPATMPAAITPEYGRYMAITGGCTGCHRANLAGGPIPGLPPDAPHAQNLTPANIGSWTEDDFARALRTGKRPDGTTINTLMPWPYTAQMTDTEIKALWLYVRSVPPVQTPAK
ncbi:MAG: cytochrome c [Candidatus Eremiobacteraeota bacterium]|nr:cytochrome c [Candidatus Eremiobacteraeota bacterium]MBV8364882.1 cytochrome c [Candidatus Eremiobacteraeota bacterium]